MEQEDLAAGVEDGSEAERSSKVIRIAREGLKRELRVFGLERFSHNARWVRTMLSGGVAFWMHSRSGL
jgi:hypothetical protein